MLYHWREFYSEVYKQYRVLIATFKGNCTVTFCYNDAQVAGLRTYMCANVVSNVCRKLYSDIRPKYDL